MVVDKEQLSNKKMKQNMDTLEKDGKKTNCFTICFFYDYFKL